MESSALYFSAPANPLKIGHGILLVILNCAHKCCLSFYSQIPLISIFIRLASFFLNSNINFDDQAQKNKDINSQMEN
jgi:hypothetical protein